MAVGGCRQEYIHPQILTPAVDTLAYMICHPLKEFNFIINVTIIKLNPSKFKHKVGEIIK